MKAAAISPEETDNQTAAGGVGYGYFDWVTDHLNVVLQVRVLPPEVTPVESRARLFPGST